MRINLIVALLLYPIARGAGQLLFKLAADRAQAAKSGFLLGLAQEPLFAAALILYATLTVVWTWVLSKVPLSFAYPFVALSFVTTPLLAHFILAERLTIGLFIGAGFIVAGLGVIIYAR